MIRFVPKLLERLAGIFGGPVGRRAFRAARSRLDRDRTAPPAPKRRCGRLGRVALALVLAGTVSAAVRALGEPGARGRFAALTREPPSPGAPSLNGAT
jgi:hypothetical protein